MHISNYKTYLHYHKNKELKKNHYDINKELIKARTSYHYYLKQNRLEEFKEKYPERYDKLVRINYIKLQYVHYIFHYKL